MRLFDKVVSQKKWDALSRFALPDPSQTVVLCADAVCGFAWKEHIERSKTLVDAVDVKVDYSKFPFATPPFEKCFVEANSPPERVPGTSSVSQFGAVCWRAEGLPLGHDSWRTIRAATVASKDTSLWALSLVFNSGGERLHEGPMAVIGIEPSGTVVGAKYIVANHSGLSMRQARDLVGLSSFFVDVVLLSFTFLNCSNVKLDDVTEELQPEPKIRRRLKLPEVKRYTLNIAGHASRPSRDYNEGPQGVMPFHLCRGHFATYTEERKLFGKYVGRFWIPPHMKGKKEQGEIIKDYAIQG